MADIKIVNLNPLLTQDSTDIYEVSKDGTGSFKETRAQQASYISSIISPTQTTTNYVAGATITAASIKGGVLIFTPTSAQTYTLDTAANIYSAMGSPAVNSFINVKLINKSNFIATITKSDTNLLISGVPNLSLNAQQTYDWSFQVTSVSPVQITINGGTNSQFANITSGNISGATLTNVTLSSPKLLETTSTVIAGVGAGGLITSSTNQDLVAIGASAGALVPNTPTNQSRSVFVGNFSGSHYTTSGASNDQHAGFGYFALGNLTTGKTNTGLGAEALLSLTTGSSNTSVGNSASGNLLNGNNNTVLGTFAASGISNCTYSNCTLIGYSCCGSINSEVNTVVIGDNAGATLSTGSGNVLIGSISDVSNATSINRIGIGQGVVVSNDNQAVIGNGSIASIISNSSSCTLGSPTNPFNLLYIGGIFSTLPSVSTAPFVNVSVLSTYVGSGVISSTDIANKTIVLNPTLATTYTLPTPASMNTSLGSPPPNTALENVTIVNLSLFAATIAGVTGFSTSTGSNVIIAAGATRNFKVMKTGTGPTFVLY